MNRLENKKALVIGGNTGIGREVCRLFAQEGADIAVGDHGREVAGESLIAELHRLGRGAFRLDVDVRSEEQVRDLVDHAIALLGHLDILVNNAGISAPGRALETPDAAWDDVFATNVDGLWYCSRAVARQMTEREGGTIVNVGSMSAMIVNQPRWQPSYLASKAAVHQLTKALAAEWAPHGIRVNALAPGYFLTEMSPVDQPEYREWCVEPAAMKRYGLPDELGPAVVFLASDASSFMTGSVVVIDGGFTLF
jgi:NAD(P)-dependent dehydrogenase (short-subunit alcohol dehydrogenase family)